MRPSKRNETGLLTDKEMKRFGTSVIIDAAINGLTGKKNLLWSLSDILPNLHTFHALRHFKSSQSRRMILEFKIYSAKVEFSFIHDEAETSKFRGRRSRRSPKFASVLRYIGFALCSKNNHAPCLIKWRRNFTCASKVTLAEVNFTQHLSPLHPNPRLERSLITKRTNKLWNSIKIQLNSAFT